jgi:ribonuclease PH
MHCHVLCGTCALLLFGVSDVNGPRGSQDKSEKETTLMLVQALEGSLLLDKYPKSSIDVSVLVLQDDGGL